MGLKWWHLCLLTGIVLWIAAVITPNAREMAIIHAYSWRYNEAKPILERSLTLNPTDEKSLDALAQTYAGLSQPAELIPYLERYLGEIPTADTRRDDLARRLIGNRQVEKAVRVLQAGPRSTERIQVLAELSIQSGNTPAAIQLLRGLLNGKPEDILLLRRIAELQEQIGDVQAALITRRNLVADSRSDHENLESLLLLGLATDDLDAVQLAVNKLGQDTNLSLLSTDSIRTTRDVALRLGQDDNALTIALHLINRPRANALDIVVCAELLSWSGREQQALDLADQALTSFPGSLEIKRFLSGALYRVGDRERVAEVSDDIAQSTNNRADVINALWANADISNHRQVLHLTSLIPGVLPTSILEQQGFSALTLQEFTPARAAAEELAKRTGDQDALLAAISLYDGLGEIEIRNQLVQQTAQQFDLPADLLINLAYSYNSKGDFETAEFWLGQARAQLGKDTESITVARARIRLDHAWRVQSAAKADDDTLHLAAWNLAKDAILQLIGDHAYDPDLDDYFSGIVYAHLALGNREQAQARLLRIPNPGTSLFLSLSRLYIDAQENATAAELLRKVSVENLDFEQALERGWLAGQIQETVIAEESWSHALTLKPKNILVRQNRFDYYLAQKDLQQAYKLRTNIHDPGRQLALLYALHSEALLPELRAYIATIPYSRYSHEGLLSLAFLAEELTDLPLSRRYLNLALQRSPEDIALLLQLAELEARMGNDQRAAELIYRRASLAQSLDAWIEAIERARWQKNVPLARRFLDSAQKEFPQEPALVFASIELAAVTENFTEMLRNWENNPQNTSATPTAVLQLVAWAYTSTDNITQANSILRLAAPRSDVPAQILLDLARNVAALGQHREALEHYRAYLQREPADGVAWFELGESQTRIGRNGAAAFNKALALLREREDRVGLGIRASIALKRNLREQALELFQRARRLGPLEPHPACDHADLLLASDQPAKALAIVDELLNRHAYFLRGRRLQGTCHLALEDFATAAGLLEGVLQEHPQDRATMTDLAFAYEKLGRNIEARQLYERIGRQQ